MSDKVEVNGTDRDPIFARLTEQPFAVGEGAGTTPDDVQWNFEKFLVSPAGDVVGRFHPKTQPDDPAVLTAIESALGS